MISTVVRVSRFAVFLCFMLSLTPAYAGEPETTEIFPNIFMMAGGEEGINSNSVFIITKKGVVVIDTKRSPAEAEKLLLEIRKRTDLPILFTINTSFRGDHTLGNQVFGKMSTIIAHKNVSEFLTGEGSRDDLDRYKAQGASDLDDVVITPPTLVYEKTMYLALGGYYLELMHLGRGHTAGDTIVYLPTFRTVIAGDVVVNKEIPSMEYAFIEDWIQSIISIEKLDVEIVFPGHGGIAEKPMVILMRQYLEALKAQVKKQAGMGKTLKEIQDAVRPFIQKKFPNWTRQDRIDGNILRAYTEYIPKIPVIPEFKMRTH